MFNLSVFCRFPYNLGSTILTKEVLVISEKLLWNSSDSGATLCLLGIYLTLFLVEGHMNSFYPLIMYLNQ